MVSGVRSYIFFYFFHTYAILFVGASQDDELFKSRDQEKSEVTLSEYKEDEVGESSYHLPLFFVATCGGLLALIPSPREVEIVVEKVIDEDMESVERIREEEDMIKSTHRVGSVSLFMDPSEECTIQMTPTYDGDGHIIVKEYQLLQDSSTELLKKGDRKGYGKWPFAHKQKSPKRALQTWSQFESKRVYLDPVSGQIERTVDTYLVGAHPGGIRSLTTYVNQEEYYQGGRLVRIIDYYPEEKRKGYFSKKSIKKRGEIPLWLPHRSYFFAKGYKFSEIHIYCPHSEGEICDCLYFSRSLYQIGALKGVSKIIKQEKEAKESFYLDEEGRRVELPKGERRTLSLASWQSLLEHL